MVKKYSVNQILNIASHIDYALRERLAGLSTTYYLLYWEDTEFKFIFLTALDRTAEHNEIFLAMPCLK